MDAVAITSKTQEAADRFYMEHGPCCAGCDWWHHIGSLIGECRRSAPVSAEERYSVVRMEWSSYRLREQDAGHILTNREHHCGDFKDGFDWPSLPAPYLRRIGWATRNAGVTVPRGETFSRPDADGASSRNGGGEEWGPENRDGSVPLD